MYKAEFRDAGMNHEEARTFNSIKAILNYKRKYCKRACHIFICRTGTKEVIFYRKGVRRMEKVATPVCTQKALEEITARITK